MAPPRCSIARALPQAGVFRMDLQTGRFIARTGQVKGMRTVRWRRPSAWDVPQNGNIPHSALVIMAVGQAKGYDGEGKLRQRSFEVEIDL